MTMAKIKCERCGETLKPEKIVWLEFGQNTGLYYKEVPEGEVSQGFFAFGSSCAKSELKETEFKLPLK